MSEKPSSLSFTSLEVPAHIEGGANYLDYWKRHEAADEDLIGARALGAAVRAGSAYLRDPDGRSPMKVIADWDASVGSFNHMQHGQGDLLRGAAILLKTNHKGRPKEFPVVRVHNPKDTTDAFLDIASQLGDMADQIPSKAMKLGGQLVHKAALIESDADRQSALFDVATTMYERNYLADTPWDKDKIKTGQFLADIRMHRISLGIRRALRAKQGIKVHQRQAATVLQNQAEDLLRYEDLVANSRSPGELVGEASEILTTLAVRHMVYLASNVKGDHSQIRTAFDSEEHPHHPEGTIRKRSFDLVHTRVNHDDQVVGSRLWQMKCKSGINYNPELYHRGIDVVTLRDLKLAEMFRLGRSLRRVYASGDYKAPVAKLPLVSEVVKPYMLPRSKAA